MKFWSGSLHALWYLTKIRYAVFNFVIHVRYSLFICGICYSLCICGIRYSFAVFKVFYRIPHNERRSA